jgi:hypothetical protein
VASKGKGEEERFYETSTTSCSSTLYFCLLKLILFYPDYLLLI